MPRIAIHAFCETPDTTVLLERAAVDRRLAKTHLTVHMGGLAKAVDHFQNAATPNLVIIETLDSGDELFAQLGELAEVCDPSTKVIIIGRANDIGLYRELMRQGISPQAACEEAIRRIARKQKGYEDFQVGFLALNREGGIGAYAIQPGFSYALTREGVHEVVKAASLL